MSDRPPSPELRRTSPLEQKPVLIVGWDGGSWTVFRPLVEKGRMPNLKVLMDRGCWGVMRSTVPYLTPPAWTTMATGLRPEKHGLFGFFEGRLLGDPLPGGVDSLRPVNSRSVQAPDLHDLFSAAGRNVLSVNFPTTWPPRPIRGVMVCGMMTPLGTKDFTWPPELKEELAGYEIDITGGTDPKKKTIRSGQYDDVAFVRKCTEIMRKRSEAVRRLGRKYPWDLGLVVFTGPDRICHRVWTPIAAYVAGDGPGGRIGEALDEFFGELDAALGRLTEDAPDARVLIVSDHGFGPRPTRAVYPNVCLERGGFLVRLKRPSEGSVVRRLARDARRIVRRLMETLLPRRLVRRLLASVDTRETRVMRTLDLARTRAYFVNVDNGEYGAVRLVPETTAALKDAGLRPGEAGLPPGDAGLRPGEAGREALIEEILAALQTMTDPGTGAPVAAEVSRARDVFPDAPDPVRDLLPEIVIHFFPNYTGRVDPLETRLVDEHVASPPGWHRMEGMYVLAGAPARPAGESPELSLEDVAPTVLYLAGLPVPPAMQGEIPVHLLDDRYVAEHPAVTGGPGAAEPGNRARPRYSPDEEQELRDRLKHLGYLE